MAYQVHLRSQGPPQGTELLAEVTAIDRPKLIKLIEDSNRHDLADPRTPKRLEYFQKHRQLCTDLGHPIYSTAAIFKICHEIQPHNYPEMLAPLPDQNETGQPARLSEVQAASGTELPALPRLIHFPALALDIPVDGESFEEIFQELTEQLGADTLVNCKLMFLPASKTARMLVRNNSDFQRYKQCAGHFECGPALPTTPPVARVGAAPASDDTIRRRLDYELDTDSPGSRGPRSVLDAQKLAVYESGARSNITTRLAAKFPSKIALPTSAQEVLTLMTAFTRIDKEYQHLMADIRRDDGVTDARRLQWFLQACILVFSPALMERWEALPESSREVQSFTSTFEFFVVVYRASVDKAWAAQLEPADLMAEFAPPAQLASSQALLQAVTVHHQAVSMLARLLGHQDTALIESAELRFWKRILSPVAQNEVVKALVLEKAERLPLFATDKFPPLTAFRVPDIRRAVEDRSGLQGLWTADFVPFEEKRGSANPAKKREVDGPPIAPTPTSGPGPERVRRGAADLTQPKERTLTDSAGQRHTFPWHLPTIDAQSERSELERLFLECVLQDTAECALCGAVGHKKTACPQLMNLVNGVERNAGSFFFQLRPPQRLLQLRDKAPSRERPARVMPVRAEPALETAVPATKEDVELLRAQVTAVLAALHNSSPLNGAAGAAQ